MYDLCVVAEGSWPYQTGGLATWVNHLISALRGSRISVVSLGAPSIESAGVFRARPQVDAYECRACVGRVPEANRYVLVGLTAAEQFLLMNGQYAHRAIYVEHGDAVLESLAGVRVTEGGGPMSGTPAENAAVALRRLKQVLTAAGQVATVTRRTMRRAYDLGATRVTYIPNAVPPVVNKHGNRRGDSLGFVGRLARIKGIDRFVELAEQVDLPAVAAGLPLKHADAPGPQWTHSQAIAWNVAAPDPWQMPIRVLAMPSRLDACPFVALEAEARGIPVLLSDVADIPASPLIIRKPWNLVTWADSIARLSRCSLEPEFGYRIATRRWLQFVNSWRNIALT